MAGSRRKNTGMHKGGKGGTREAGDAQGRQGVHKEARDAQGRQGRHKGGTREARDAQSLTHTDTRTCTHTHMHASIQKVETCRQSQGTPNSVFPCSQPCDSSVEMMVSKYVT